MSIAKCEECKQFVVTQDHNCTNPAPAFKKPMNAEDEAQAVRLLLKMYQQGWNDAIAALHLAKAQACRDIDKTYKELLDYGPAQEPVTKPDLKRPRSDSIPRLR